MRLYLLGGGGQLGKAFTKEFDKTGVEFYRHPGRHFFDLGNLTELGESINRVKPDLVINCAAYNDVDAAEEDRVQAHIVNSVVPTFLGTCATAHRFGLIHFSTDAVFRGDPERRPEGVYSECDECDPVNFYGRSKLLGEDGLFSVPSTPAVVFRTSWLWSLTGECFVTKIRRLEKHLKLDVVTDVCGVPTFAGDLAKAVCSILPKEGFFDWALQNMGLYHICSEGPVVSKFGFATLIARYAGLGLRLSPVSSSQFWGCKVPRPKEIRLSCERARERFGVWMPDWDESLRRELHAAQERPAVLDRT